MRQFIVTSHYKKPKSIKTSARN